MYMRQLWKRFARFLWNLTLKSLSGFLPSSTLLLKLSHCLLSETHLEQDYNLQYSCFNVNFNFQCFSSALDDQPLCWEQPPPPLLSLLPTSFSSQPFPCSAIILECKDLLVCTNFVQIFGRWWLRVANTELHQFSSLSCFAKIKLCLYGYFA